MSALPILLGSSRHASTGVEYRELLQERLQSWLSYVAAPAIERRCIFAVVARTNPVDLEEFRGAFDDADADADGRISRRDLGKTLEVLRACRDLRPFVPRLDADALFEAADLDSNGILDFHEFAAACLHGRLQPLDRWLADQAFEALDFKRDGKLHSLDVLRVLGGVPKGLPSRRSFGVEEWRRCLLGAGSEENVSPRRAACVIEKGPPHRLKACSMLDFGFFEGCCSKTSKDGLCSSVEEGDVQVLAPPPGYPHHTQRRQQAASRSATSSLEGVSYDMGFESDGPVLPARGGRHQYRNAPEERERFLLGLSGMQLSSPTYVPVIDRSSTR